MNKTLGAPVYNYIAYMSTAHLLCELELIKSELDLSIDSSINQALVWG